jgi:ubiquinol-cytochrome c reductase cytochrome b subunit
LTGLVLLGVVILLAFTGQLLPYNQAGYWAATVGIQIASAAPIVGEAIRQMMTGGDTVGALTLTRFYAMHVVVLPALLGLLVVWHLVLLRKHGPMRAVHDDTDATEPFFPRQFFRDMVAISVGLFCLFTVASVVGGPKSPALDLSDESYTPRPEWYFLAHYELLKLTRGELQRVLVAFVLPTVGLLTLALLPWLDRGKTAAMRHRRPVVAAAIVVAAVGTVLTGYGVATTPPEGEPESAVAEVAPAEDEGIDAQIALGRRVFRQQQCFKCHVIGTVGADIGPDLTIVGLRIKESFLRDWLKNPKSFKPQTIMPPVKTSPENFEALVAYLLSLDVVPGPAGAADGSSDAPQ